MCHCLLLRPKILYPDLLRFLTTMAMSEAEAAMDIPPDTGEPASTSRIQSSFLGIIGAAFLYLDALKRHAIAATGGSHRGGLQDETRTVSVIVRSVTV